MENSKKNSSQTFSDFLRVTFKDVVTPVAAFLNRLGLTPNMVTLAGLAGQIIAGGLIAAGYITFGGLLLVLVAPLDFLDGTMARLRGTPSRFGAFLDSATDRYAELAIFGGLLIYYTQRMDVLACVLVYLAAAGSLMVSYVRARAQGLGYEAKIGLLSRVERYLILVPLLIFNVPFWAVVILAIFTNLTAIQRIFYVRRMAEQDANNVPQ
ncbi:MAG: CDP-alcohol phosphatidyltransferase family protein [Anaerolineae bacterium]|nr:CDP-alcohol phosphatidyltransferase family protein [Anaerolineae bacterium]